MFIDISLQELSIIIESLGSLSATKIQNGESAHVSQLINLLNKLDEQGLKEVFND